MKHIYNIVFLPIYSLFIYALVSSVFLYLQTWPNPNIENAIAVFFTFNFMMFPAYVLIIIIGTPLYLLSTWFIKTPLTASLITVPVPYFAVIFILFSDTEFTTLFHELGDMKYSIVVGFFTALTRHTYLYWSRLTRLSSGTREKASRAP